MQLEVIVTGRIRNHKGRQTVAQARSGMFSRVTACQMLRLRRWQVPQKGLQAVCKGTGWEQMVRK